MWHVVLINGNVPCHYICSFHFDFEIAKCHLSNLKKGLRLVGYIFLMLISSMSHVNFKKCPCRLVKQGPPQCHVYKKYELINL